MRTSLNRIAAICLAGLFAAVGAGCAERLQQTFSAIGTATSVISSASASTVDSRAVLVAANTFDGLQALATQYLSLPRCSEATKPICREPSATAPLINATYAGRKARKAALRYIKEHPCPNPQESCPLGTSGVYDALQQAVATIQDIYTNYNVARTVAAAKQ